MRDRRRNKKIIVFLVGILLLMSIGYAAFQTQLDIKGTTNISSTWSIRIISADVLNINGDAENVKNTYTDLTANLEANLYNKGDYIEYKIIVENNGNFDAKLETLGITNSNNEAVKITSSGFTKGQTLYKNTSEELTVRIAYNSDYEGDAEGTSGESNITLGFSQAEGGTIVPTVDHLVTYDYVTNGGESTTAENEYVAEGTDINLSYTASKTGYDFIGWNTNSQAGNALESLSMGTEDITLFAIFRAQDTTPPVIDNISYTATTSTITVAVSAHDDETAITKYEYSIDDGEWVDGGTSSSYTFTGLVAGTSYSIKVRVTNEVGLQAEDTIGGTSTSDLTKDVITSGDGLYSDTVEEGRYIYRGANPNNYITFNDETWRIISVESDGIIKIIRNEQLSNALAWDTAGTRNRTTSTYCTNASPYGCNAWAATSNLVGTPSEFTQYYNLGNPTSYTETYTGTVTGDASLNTYLNGTYYNSLSDKDKVETGTFNVSTPGDYNDTETLEIDAEQEKQYQWQGKVALMNVTELLRASTSSGCTSLKAGVNNWSKSVCSDNNWLWPTFNTNSEEWTLSPEVDSRRDGVWLVISGGFCPDNIVCDANGVRPVLYLSSDIILSGEGTKENPFEIIEGITTPKLEKPTFKENYKSVTINYPSGCGDGLSCSYQKDSGDWIEVNENAAKVSFSESGTLVAKVNDGTNEVTNTYNYVYNADTTAPIIDNVSYTSTTNSITVVTTAHDDESGISKYEYKIDSGDWVESTENTYAFAGLTEGTSYNITVRVTNEEGLQTEKQILGGIDLTNNIVTTGDGLYEDSTKTGRYIYKGAVPNNYVNFNEELWRIIAVENDGTMKMISNFVLDSRAFDSASGRYSSSGYCTSNSNGCNAWGSSTTTYDKAGNIVTAISDTYSSTTTYALPSSESSLNIYLNGNYYNSLIETAKNQIDTHFFNVGTVSASSSNTLSMDMLEEEKYKWKGNIGLLNITDYVKASTNSTCTNAYNYNTNTSCYSNGPNHNWISSILSTHPRFINGKASSRYNIWGINSTSYVIGSAGNASNSYGVKPVLYLKSNVKIINGSGTSTVPYELGNGVSTLPLEKPTFSESGTTTKTVTITYPSGCGSNLTCTYIKDDGEEVPVTSSTIDLTFISDSSLVAKVSDGTNIISSSYTVIIIKPAGDRLKENVVTSGSGLYADTGESGKYIYRGVSPDNYITFNDEVWRIISVESDGTIKIIRNNQLSNTYAWDSYENRSSSTSTYCKDAYDHGCNAWAATENLIGTPSIFAQYAPNGNNISDSTILFGTVTQDASLNTYLNGEYYNSLTSTAKSQMVKGIFNVSTPGNYTDTETLDVDASQEKQYQWQGYVALMNVTELLKATSNTTCNSLKDGYNNSDVGLHYCSSNNWLWPISSSGWTLSPYGTTECKELWYVSSDYIGTNSAYGGARVSPVVYLASDLTLSGSGTESDPYTIIEGVTIQTLKTPTFSSNSNTVTITYPEGCGNGITCTYIKDKGEEVTVTTSTVDVAFTADGTLVAKVTNGINSVSSSYTFKTKVSPNFSLVSPTQDITDATISSTKYCISNVNLCYSSYATCEVMLSKYGGKTCTKTNTYSCSSGTLNGTQCYSDYYCPDNSLTSGSGASMICAQYNCPNGYTLNTSDNLCYLD